MDNTCRLFVFHRAADARAFNLPGKNGQPDFSFLPFAIIPDGSSGPPNDLIKATYPSYPREFVNIMLGIDWLVARSGGVDVPNLSLGPDVGPFDPDDPLQVTTRLVYECGIPVVVAAGNA